MESAGGSDRIRPAQEDLNSEGSGRRVPLDARPACRSKGSRRDAPTRQGLVIGIDYCWWPVRSRAHTPPAPWSSRTRTGRRRTGTRRFPLPRCHLGYLRAPQQLTPQHAREGSSFRRVAERLRRRRLRAGSLRLKWGLVGFTSWLISLRFRSRRLWHKACSGSPESREGAESAGGRLSQPGGAATTN